MGRKVRGGRVGDNMRWPWRRRAGLASGPGMVAVLFIAGIVVAGVVAVPLIRAMLPGDAASTSATRPAHVQRSPSETTVSLTFDDAYEDQWLYAVPLLRSHHVNATFYVITADSDGPYPCCMSWAQLRILQGEGDDIGSHTVHHANLRNLARALVMREICSSRRDMLRNGLDDPQ